MKRLLLFAVYLFLSLSVAANAGDTAGVYFIDSLPARLEAWRYIQEDSAVYAEKDFDDSQWQVIDPQMEASDTEDVHWFKGIGWFRLRFRLDSSLADTTETLAFSLTQWGASEIYLDGKLIKKFGKINGPDSSEYYDPLRSPVIIIPHRGEHVLAVRYANYRATKNYEMLWGLKAGFQASLNSPESTFFKAQNRLTILGTIILLMFGLFFTLGFLHLFIFFFSHHIYSNLVFSLFTFSIAALWATAYVNLAFHDIDYQLWSKYLIFPLVVVACTCLSGFIHILFIKRKRWLIYVVSLLSVACLFTYFIGWSDISPNILLALVAVVVLETIVVLISAIFRKIPGARILGAGLLFFFGFIIGIILIALLSGGEIIISGENPVMQYLIGISAVCAIISIPASISIYLAWNFGSINNNLKQQLDKVQVLSEEALKHEQEKQRLMQIRQDELEQKVNERTEELRKEKQKSDDLLLNILPAEVAEELKRDGTSEARQYENVTVLFSDFVNFTGVSEKLSPKDLVKEIDHCFKAFDKIIGNYKLEKIKTIGDAYLAVCGLPEPNADHARTGIEAALAIRDFMADYQQQGGIFQVRTGLHSGQVVAGIVGVKKFAYDIWGDTVNMAARMEQNGQPGQINISQTTYDLIKDYFRCRPRGKVHAKNKGEVEMYFVESVNEPVA